MTFDLALVVEGAKLCLVVRRWSLWGLPLPLILAPAGDSYETVIDDRFHFHVEIRHCLIGLIVGYCGWLETSQRADAAVLAETAPYPCGSGKKLEKCCASPDTSTQ